MTGQKTPSNDIEITLGEADAVDSALYIGPAGDLGTDEDISLKQIRLRIGRRPTVCKLRELYKVLELEFPKELELFSNYEVWLFAFRIHLMKDGGFQSVREFGCQVKYPENYAVSIVSYLPDTEFITVVDGHVNASASIEATGEAKLPLAGAAIGSAMAKIGGGIQAQVSADAKVNISLSVLADRVVATGGADFVGEWSVKRGDKPLIGEQQFLHMLLVPKEMERLDVEIRAFVTVGTGYLVPTRLNSEWVPLVASLTAPGDVAKVAGP